MLSQGSDSYLLSAMPLIQILALLQLSISGTTTAAIRVNQLGYLPDAPKVAVFCALEKTELREFIVADTAGKEILRRPPSTAKPFGSCVVNYRLDFSSIRKNGDYRVSAGGGTSPNVRLRPNVYGGAPYT